MSDEENKKKKEEILVTIDRSQELQTAEEENARLKTQLETIATQEFEKECKRFGLDPEHTDPATLKAVQQLHEQTKSAPRGGDTAPLDSSQVQGKTVRENIQLDKERDQLPLDMIQFDDLHDMMQYLEKVSNDGRDERNKQARRAIGKLINKVTDKSHTYEFQGGIRDILNSKKDPSKKLLFEEIKDEEGEK